MLYDIKPDPPKKIGKHWKGGRIINSSGYVIIYKPNHHRADNKGYVLEHILVAEIKIGRPVTKGEEVHHIDFNRQNNSPANLEVLTKSEHAKIHHPHTGAVIKCSYCNKDFYRIKSIINKNKKHYCCKDCYAKDKLLFNMSDDEWIEIFKSKTVTQFAKENNFSRLTIQDYKNKLIKKGTLSKVECKGYQKTLVVNKQQMVDAIKKYRTVKDISGHFGVDPANIRKKIKNLGLYDFYKANFKHDSGK